MSVGVMKDYKLKRRNLRASQTLSSFFVYLSKKKKCKKGPLFFVKKTRMRLHMACLITLGCAHVRPVRTGAVPAFLKQYLPSLDMRRHPSSAAV
jgi:hypothetical protein